MQESWPYRKELATFAESFQERAEKQPWRDYSLAKAERMLFVGFLYVRKLIECERVSEVCARSTTALLRAPIWRPREDSGVNRYDLVKGLETVTWSDDSVDAYQLSGKVISASSIAPVQQDARGLAGFAFATDRHRKSELWLLPSLSIAETFDRFARNAVNGATDAAPGAPGSYTRQPVDESLQADCELAHTHLGRYTEQT